MGCPHSKIHTLFPVLYCRVRPQLLIDIIMGSLSEQILVKFRDFLGERQRCCLLSRLFIPLCLISHTFTSTRQELLLFLLYQCAKPLSTNANNQNCRLFFYFFCLFPTFYVENGCSKEHPFCCMLFLEVLIPMRPTEPATGSLLRMQSKSLRPLVLAPIRADDLGTCPEMSIKEKCKLLDMRISGMDCESALHGAIHRISHYSSKSFSLSTMQSSSS